MNIGKNNITKKIFKESQRKPHFGIRKLSVGIASVLLSTTLLFGVASEVTPSFSLGLASVYAEEQLTYENATEDDYRTHFPSLSDDGIKKFMYYCQQVIPEIKDTQNGKSFIAWVNGGFKQPTMPRVTDEYVDKIVGNLKIDDTYAEKLKEKYQDIFSLTSDTVQASDLDKINEFLNDYEKLPEKVKPQFEDTAAKLIELKKQLEMPTPPEDTSDQEFKQNNAEILAKTPDTVTVADKAAVEKALNDYNALSPEAQAKLTDEKANLDKLQAKIAEQEAQDAEVAKFKSDNADALAKTPDTVTVADKAAVEKALNDYNALSPASQAKLTAEKANLDALKAKIAEQEAQDAEVAKFKSDNADALAKTPETVTVADKAAVEKALNDYNALSPASQAKLTAEKANLDALKAKIAEQEAQDSEVAKFKSDNADALAKTPETVTVADKAAVEKALEDYAKLSPASQAKLTAEKANLDALKAKIAEQEADGENVDSGSDNGSNNATKVEDRVNVYQVYNPNTGEWIYTTDKAEYDNLVKVGWTGEGVAWIASNHGTAIYRLYNKATGQHLYTADKEQYDLLATQGWTQEGLAFYSNSADGLAVRHLYNAKTGQHVYTTSQDESDELVKLGWTVQDNTWNAAAHVTNIYRVYNYNTGEHLYTADENEYNKLASLGWKKEGVAWQTDSLGDKVYRLYQASTGTHHFTTSEAEYVAMAAQGWTQEGVAFYTDSSKSVEVFHLFNPKAKAIAQHLFTTDVKEREKLVARGWQVQESIYRGL